MYWGTTHTHTHTQQMMKERKQESLFVNFNCSPSQPDLNWLNSGSYYNTYVLPDAGQSGCSFVPNFFKIEI